MQTAEDIQLLIQELELKNRFLLSENRRLEEKLAKLCDELRYLRRTLFGRSSERFAHSDPNQLAFDFMPLLLTNLTMPEETFHWKQACSNGKLLLRESDRFVSHCRITLNAGVRS